MVLYICIYIYIDIIIYIYRCIHLYLELHFPVGSCHHLLRPSKCLFLCAAGEVISFGTDMAVAIAGLAVLPSCPRSITGTWQNVKQNGTFQSHGGTPIAGWFVRENPNQKWMMTGGSPISWTPNVDETHGDPCCR